MSKTANICKSEIMSTIPEDFWTDSEPTMPHRCLTCSALPLRWSEQPCADCDHCSGWTPKTDIVVLRFIAGFNSAADLFLHGRCYWFAVILRERFNGVIMYNEIDNHFACLVDNCLYDVTGIIPASGFVSWLVYQADEPLNAGRVVRDCIVGYSI